VGELTPPDFTDVSG